MIQPVQKHGVALQSGFTLIELMVTVIMIGIMVATVIPEMRGTMDDALLRATARKLVMAIDLAHSQAITTGTAHRMNLNLKKSEFVIEKKSSGEDRAQGFVPVDTLSGLEGSLDSRITIRIHRTPAEAYETRRQESSEPIVEESVTPSREETIQFEPDGTAERVELVLRDRQGFGLALRINPITARVRIVERPHE